MRSPGVSGVTVGAAVCRERARSRRNAQAPKPGKATPGDATCGRDSRPRGHTHRKMFAAALFIKARNHKASSARLRGACHIKSWYVGSERLECGLTNNAVATATNHLKGQNAKPDPLHSSAEGAVTWASLSTWGRVHRLLGDDGGQGVVGGSVKS